MKIKSVEPTVFYRADGDTLRQVVRVTLQTDSAAELAQVLVQAPGVRSLITLRSVSQGRSVHEVNIPDIREPGTVTFSVLQNSALQDELQLDWVPMRHWEVYVVHCSHHDLGFTDLPSNVFEEHDRFLNDVVRFCDETADWPDDSRFRYTIEQGWSIAHYVAHRPPAAIERVMELVRQGRIEVNALFGNQTTELCSHEEQVRLMYPSFALKHRYGIPVLTAEHNDVPGLSWGLASVLAGAGIRYFAPRLPAYFLPAYLPQSAHRVHNFWDEEQVLPGDLGGAFWWEGPDGQRVLLWYGFRIALWTYEQALHELEAELTKHAARGYAHDVIRFGFQGGGRDNAPPDVRLSHIARQWNKQWRYPRLVVATNRMFFEQLEKRGGAGLRVLRGDLPNTDYTVGALSTMRETVAGRGAQSLLTAAERLAACASLVADFEYPASALTDAYEKLMLFDEHTWGMAHPIGPAQDAAWNEKGGCALHAAAVAHDVLLKSTNKIADEAGVAAGGYHLLVFNPLTNGAEDVGRADLVSVPAVTSSPIGRPMHWRVPAGGEDGPAVFVSGRTIGRDIRDLPRSVLDGSFELTDVETALPVPYQIVSLTDSQAARPLAASRFALGGCSSAERKTLTFVAHDVPSLGYKTYRIVPTTRPAPQESSLRVGHNWLENRFYRVELDPETGVVASIYDKELSREWVDGRAAHGMHQVVVRSAETGAETVAAHSFIAPGEIGPVLASLIVCGDAAAPLPGCPQRTQEIVLYDGLKRIDFATRLLKDSTGLMEVYIAFPFDLQRPQFRFEASNSVIEPIRDQLPGSNTDAYALQHWADVCDETGGVTWTSLDAPVMELGGLWPGYVSEAHHCVTPPGFGHDFLRDPAQLDRGHIYSYVFANNFRVNFQPVQLADVLFRYSITTHSGDWRAGRAGRFGWQAMMPLMAVGVLGPQVGSLGASESFCQVDPLNIMLSALKRAEDGDGLIVRLIETMGRPTRAVVTLPRLEIDEAFATNLVEENGATLSCERHRTWVDLPAYGIATVRCRSAQFQ